MAEKKDTFTFTLAGEKGPVTCVLRKPDFPHLRMAMAALTTVEGKLDMAGSGEVIFNTCKVSCDAEIEKDGNLMMSLCMKIAEQFISPVNVEVKKN